MNRKLVDERKSGSVNARFAVDTTFVLFFLALEFGRSLTAFELDGALLGVSVVMLMVLPYFLAPDGEETSFGKWILGRMLIACLATAIGVIFQNLLGVTVPEVFRFLPMTLLIATAMLSCYIQFYGFLKFRVAK